MSVLHHEEILEDCLFEAEENFRVHNKLTQKQLDELIVRSEGVRLATVSYTHLTLPTKRIV